ncbi:hypothetical protein K5X82_07260 [Halosquirtibacter xylanolyticus]|uniref:hypothetical protein n=1 Tax=Halosquirtibacter xylanolyticus TaxID=3374599 RepID=UPI0037494D13|nr:hypothetical protein K5X82_07260 [Prolixibacteraceae bacterium]
MFENTPITTTTTLTGLLCFSNICSADTNQEKWKDYANISLPQIEIFQPVENDISGITNIYLENFKEESTDLYNRLSDIKKLESNWDGYGAVKFNPKVISNAIDLIKSLPSLDLVEITPFSHGTIGFDWELENGEINLEIGMSEINIVFDDFEKGYSDKSFTIEESFDNELRSILIEKINIFNA